MKPARIVTGKLVQGADGLWREEVTTKPKPRKPTPSRRQSEAKSRALTAAFAQVRTPEDVTRLIKKALGFGQGGNIPDLTRTPKGVD